MPKCILSGQVKSTFTQEQADGRYIQMVNGATTTLASSLQVSGINNIEFTEEGENPITASNVSYSNTTSGMTSGNVQNAIDELFQSVSEGKSLIAAAVTDKGVETAATDSFATMAGNIGQISSGGGSKQYKFTYDYRDNSEPPTLDGEPIDVGDTFDLEAGSMHVLYTNAEGASFETESGKYVPYIVSESAPTRALPLNFYVSFVMPNENCRYWY